MKPIDRFKTTLFRDAPLLLVTLALTLAGCSTDKSASSTPRPGSGLVEYRQLVKRSHDAIDGSIRSLDKVSAQPHCPTNLVASFSDQVDHLAAESVQVRARSQAMQSRGDAYFDNWTANMASMKDPKMREQAERHRTELQQSFARIKSTSLETRSAFQQYLAGLRQLRNALENDPAALSVPATKETAEATRRNGLEVERGLDTIRDELAGMMLMLVPGDAKGSR
jgi:hypothetical protein